MRVHIVENGSGQLVVSCLFVCLLFISNDNDAVESVALRRTAGTIGLPDDIYCSY